MGAPVIRQSAGNGVGATSLITIPQALGSAVLAGSRLMAYITWGASTGTVTGVSDTINLTAGWAPVPNTLVADTGGPTQSQWWTNPNSAAGPAPTITATYSVAQQFRAIIVQEITGSDPSDTILASAKDQTTTTTSMVSNSITTLVKNCLVIGACSNDTNAVAPTAGTGYTLDKTTTNQVTATEWQAQAAAGAITAAFTFGTAAAGVIQIIALKPAPLLSRNTVVQGAAAPDFFGKVFLLKSLVLSAPPPPTSILQRRTLHQFGTHAGGRTVRGDS